LDPDTLLPKYLELQTRLYNLQPEIFDKPKKGKKSGREKTASASAEDPQVASLQRKIASIENDVLFDKAEAEYRWREKLDDLRKEAAFLRQSQPKDKPEQDDTKEAGEKEPENSVPLMDEDETADLLGDMFQAEEPTLESGVILEELNKAVLNMRDFGKWTGLSPRRVLEETCKARYVISLKERCSRAESFTLGTPDVPSNTRTFLPLVIPTARLLR
jgi:ATP-dependent RNA helicase DHX29